MTDKFRIQSVRIEGFKGFTKEQEIPLQSNNTFVFGNNGFGKSSILEAIAWCLFGESRKSETELRNSDYYDGDCKVELKLTRNSEERRVLRRMTRASAEAPADVILQNGERRGLNATFPDRKRLGGPGTDVLFATQGVAGRSVSDITNFKDVISAHLGLDRIEGIRKELKTQADNFEKDFAESEKKWTKYEEEIDTEIQKTNETLNEMQRILATNTSSLPTKSDTDKAIVDLYSELASDPSDKEEFLRVTRHQRLERLNQLLKNIQLSKETIRSKIVHEQTNLNEIVAIKQSYETAILSKNSLQDGIETVVKQKIEKFDNLTSKILDEHVSAILEQRTSLERDFQDKKKELETKIAQLASSAETTQSQLSELLSLISERAQIETQISQSKEARESVLGQYSEDSLRTAEKYLEETIKQKNLLQAIVIQADEYCQLHGYNECPVCNAAKDMSHLLKSQASSLPEEASKIVKELKTVKSKLEALAVNALAQRDLDLELKDIGSRLGENPSQRAIKLQESIQSQKTNIEGTKQTLLDLEKERRDQIQALDQQILLLNEQRSQIYQLELKESNSRGSLQNILKEISQLEERARASPRFELLAEQVLESLARSVERVTKQISLFEDQEANAASAIRNYEARLKQLTLESQYHQLKDHRLSLLDHKSSDEWKEVESKFEDYRSFLDELSTINSALAHVYENELRARIERINERIGPVYKLLTQQRSYPFAEIRLENDEKNGLEVRLWVGTGSRDLWRRPEEVLNEQARNAVRLLPYFVFSELGMLQHDFDFLLIDDPSQSFDSSHLDSLMKLLESISSEVQIIVATHEKARFEDFVGKLPRTSVIEVENFEPSRGPKLVYNGPR
jgi:DNA repair exonuclease SbcCD ATPase subunit